MGLNIYKVVSDIDEIHFVAQDFEIKYDADFKLDNIILKSWNEKLDVKETGKNAIENAYLKAKAYYETTGIASIGLIK